MTSVAIPPQEIRNTEGGVFAYLLPAAEVDRMRAEIESLREQVAKLERQRDYYSAEVARMILTYVPQPMTEEEIADALKNPGDLSDLIAELESR